MAAINMFTAPARIHSHWQWLAVAGSRNSSSINLFYHAYCSPTDLWELAAHESERPYKQV